MAARVLAILPALFLAPFMAQSPVLAQSQVIAQSQAQPAEDYLAEGLQALNGKQLSAAESLLRKAVAADPASVQASFNLALVLGMEGGEARGIGAKVNGVAPNDTGANGVIPKDTGANGVVQKDTEAIAAYRKTLELQPALFEADLNLGIILLRDKQPSDALPVLKEASELKPAEFRPQLFYAQALYDTGDFAGAEQHFRTAVSANPQSAAANLGIARSLLKQSRLEESAGYFRAAALDPAYKNALLELGTEYDKTGEAAQAIEIYREFPSNEAATKRLTQLLLDTHNALAAIPALEAAVKNAPTTTNRMALIDAYREAGEKARAAEQLKLAVAADPTSFDLRMAYGRTLRDGHQFAAAAGEFQAAVALQPGSAPALNELAGVLIMAGQLDDGLGALDRVRALGKEIPGDMYLRAITLDKLHRNKPALDAYREFLAAANGKFPNEEFLSRQRVRIIEHEMGN